MPDAGTEGDHGPSSQSSPWPRRTDGQTPPVPVLSAVVREGLSAVGAEEEGLSGTGRGGCGMVETAGFAEG